jgi:hypothetical protein
VAVFKELDFRELRETVVAKIDGIKFFFFLIFFLPQMLANVSTAIVRRVRKCLEVDGTRTFLVI